MTGFTSWPLTRRFRSNTSVCLNVDLPLDKLQKVIKLLEDEQVAHDIASYREAPPGLRFWCGATVEQSDLQLALQWLDWAYHEVSTGEVTGGRFSCHPNCLPVRRGLFAFIFRRPFFHECSHGLSQIFRG